jgi:hypothetical protein
VKKEVLITFEIREKVERIPIAFVVKEEIEKFKGIKLEKGTFEWYTKANTKIQNKILKLLTIAGFNNQHS